MQQQPAPNTLLQYQSSWASWTRDPSAATPIGMKLQQQPNRILEALITTVNVARESE